MTSTITFFVNGNEVSVDNPDPEMTLATFLRYKLHLTGTKLACEEGACGACTVAIARWNNEEKRARFVSANACITPLYLVDGALVLTVEGIGSTKRLHPIQQRLSSGNATQCGFCSPGFVMATYALLRNHPEPTLDQIRTALVGNLCRCTGYRPILEAVESFSKKSGGCCQGGSGGCPCKEVNGIDQEENGEESKTKDQRPEINCGLVNYDSLQKFDESSEIIFPPKLLMTKDSSRALLYLKGRRVELYCPSKIKELKELVGRLPRVDRYVSTGMLTRQAQSLNPEEGKSIWISIHRIDDLHRIDNVDGEISIGSGCTLRDMIDAISKYCKNGQYVEAIQDQYRKYSSDQVKNNASWAGALASVAAKFDACTIALALRWRVRLYNIIDRSYSTLSIDEFYSGPMENPVKMKPNEILVALLVPANPIVKAATFKHGARFGGDDAVVNGCASYDNGTCEVRVAMGLYKRPIVLERVGDVLSQRLKGESKNGEDSEIRTALEKDLLMFNGEQDFSYKFGIAKAAIAHFQAVFSGSNGELGISLKNDTFEALQLYKSTDPSEYPVGRPLRHVSADRHTTGEAQYVDDIKIHDLKHAALVLSREAHARIISIDPSAALAVEGVIAYVDVKDIPSNGMNRPSLHAMFVAQDDTPVFADGKVEMVGQPIGCVIADDVITARRAAKLVRVEYEKLPAILTIKEAISQNSYLATKPSIYGNSEEEITRSLEECPIVFEGEVEIGGQEHAYMETQSSLVIPHENDEWTIYTSSQSPSEAQYLSSCIIGVPSANVIVKVKRLGGGFGGKCTGDRIPRGPALVAAHKLRKPVSCVLSRYDDFFATGKRHPALFKYRIGIDKDGRLLVVDVVQYLQGGYAIDQSIVIGSEVYTANACYRVPCMRTVSWVTKTNTCSNTAFRAYGRPQTFFFMETVMNQVAHRVGKTLEELKKLNLLREGDMLLCGSPLHNYCLPQCWQEVEEMSDYFVLRKQCEQFNMKSKRVKRGVAISGSVQFISTPGFMEQGTALVQLLLDGTVRVNVGAVEMGQGLNTKMIQIAATTLNVPFEKVTIVEMATDKTATTVESGASMGTDTSGWAVKVVPVVVGRMNENRLDENNLHKACEKLLVGIAPHMEKCGGNWTAALHSAFMAKVPLQTSETIQIERKAYGMPEGDFPYCTSGAACVMVEVDCMTGEHKLVSVDIVMDVGDSINPALDIGQIEGGFMQGYGLMTSEELEYDHTGKLLTNGLYNYKIPTIHMVPNRFRVKLLERGHNYPGQIFRSKGIGEPPLLLSNSVHSALRMAINSYRNGKEFLNLSSPLTARRILAACNDQS